MSIIHFIDQHTGLQFQSLWPSLPFLLKGVWVTLGFMLVSLFFGLIFGVVLSALRMLCTGVIEKCVVVYVSIFRGTPLLVQLAMIYFALPQLTGCDLSAFSSAVLSMSLNSAAYVSEILRGALHAVDKGQWEASMTLGLTRLQTFRYVIFPQAFATILPSLVNEATDILKESSLVSTIGAWDLMYRANMIAAEKYIFFEPLLVVATMYYMLVMLFTLLVLFLKKRFYRYDYN